MAPFDEDRDNRIAAHLRSIARSALALADEFQPPNPSSSGAEAPKPNPNPSAAESPKYEDTAGRRPGLENEVARIRDLKERNISWAQLRRGSEDLTGRDDHLENSPRKRSMDRSLAKRIAGRASLTVEELLAVLDEARLGHDEKGFAADLSLYGDKDDEDSGDEGNPDPAE